MRNAARSQGSQQAAPAVARTVQSTRVRASGRLQVPTLCCLIAATVSFGAARIQAGVTPDSGEQASSSVTTKVVDFVPAAFTPAAFADWSEPQAQK